MKMGPPFGEGLNGQSILAAIDMGAISAIYLLLL